MKAVDDRPAHQPCEFCKDPYGEERYHVFVCAGCEMVLHKLVQDCPACLEGTIDKCTHCGIEPNSTKKNTRRGRV